jgi:hypothetical protein
MELNLEGLETMSVKTHDTPIACPVCSEVVTFGTFVAHKQTHDVAADNTDAVTTGRALDTGAVEPTHKRSNRKDHQIHNAKTMSNVEVTCGGTGNPTMSVAKRTKARKAAAKRYGVKFEDPIVAFGAHSKIGDNGDVVRESHEDWVDRGGKSAWAAKYGAPEAHTVPDADSDAIVDGMAAEGDPAFDREVRAHREVVLEIVRRDNERFVETILTLRGDVDTLKRDNAELLELLTASETEPETLEVPAAPVPDHADTLNAANNGRAASVSPLDKLDAYK